MPLEEVAKQKLPDLAVFRRGLAEALFAAAEEHDRDADEIISPATVAFVESPTNYGSSDWSLIVKTKDGRRFRVSAVEEVF